MKDHSMGRAGHGRICRAATALGVAWLLYGPEATATPPTPPVEIVTPDEAARIEGVVRDEVEIRIREDQVTGLKTRVILFREGRELMEAAIDTNFQRLREEDEQAGEGPLSVARIPAVPQEFVSRAEPGVYAHKIIVEVGLLGEGAGNYVAYEWVRWRTDGERVELLTGERYSALTERVDTAVEADGERVLVFQGSGRELADSDRPVPPRFDTRVGDGGVVPEQPVELKDHELKRSLDERDED
jgi:hypothetical protein